MHISVDRVETIARRHGARVGAFLAHLDGARVTAARAADLLVARGLAGHGEALAAAHAWARGLDDGAAAQVAARVTAQVAAQAAVRRAPWWAGWMESEDEDVAARERVHVRVRRAPCPAAR